MLDISLGESLCGLDRVVLKHLDGRGIHVRQARGRILRPDQVLKVPGEGMPMKKSDARGDLYLVVRVVFPEDAWTNDAARMDQIEKSLPPPPENIKAEIVDEVDFEPDADLEEVCIHPHPLAFPISFPIFFFSFSDESYSLVLDQVTPEVDPVGSTRTKNMNQPILSARNNEPEAVGGRDGWGWPGSSGGVVT